MVTLLLRLNLAIPTPWVRSFFLNKRAIAICACAIRDEDVIIIEHDVHGASIRTTFVMGFDDDEERKVGLAKLAFGKSAD